MLREAQDLSNIMLRPWLLLGPGVLIFLTVLAFNVVGDKSRDVLDPKSHGKGIIEWNEMMSDTLLTVSGLTVAFPTDEGAAMAVNNLSFTVAPRQVLGLVGKAVAGKSITSMALFGLGPQAGHITAGSIKFEGRELVNLPDSEYRKIRGAKMALIPQDPLTSLNPVYTIGNQLTEVITLHQGVSQADATRRAIELLDLVRLPNAKSRIQDYPHQFSGGMRQCVMIAMALSCNPQLLIADEPTTALDVTVQAQILTLMRDIQKAFGQRLSELPM